MTDRDLTDDFQAGGHQHVPVNVYETDQAIVVVAAMPGVQADDITIELRDGLRLAAELRTSAPKDYLVKEWEYGSYEREIDLPGDVGSPVTASYGNGQLVVSLTKGGSGVDGPIEVAGS